MKLIYKLNLKLGNFPLPVEVLQISQSLVALGLVKIGGRPVLRENFNTDNGNVIFHIIGREKDSYKDINEVSDEITKIITSIENNPTKPLAK